MYIHTLYLLKYCPQGIINVLISRQNQIVTFWKPQTYEFLLGAFQIEWLNCQTVMLSFLCVSLYPKDCQFWTALNRYNLMPGMEGIEREIHVDEADCIISLDLSALSICASAILSTEPLCCAASVFSTSKKTQQTVNHSHTLPNWVSF